MTEIDWSKLISIEYWLEGVAGDTSITPVIEYDSFFFWLFLVLFSLVFAVGVILRIIDSHLDDLNPLKSKLNLLGDNLIWIAIVSDMWFLFRQLSVGLLGARFWLLVISLWFVGIVIYLGRYFTIYFKYEYLYFKQRQKHLKAS